MDEPGAQKRLPSWLRRELPRSKDFESVRRILRANTVSTVCESAKCPNIFECFGSKSVTFLILGETCTRNCKFCAVSKGLPSIMDPTEPERIAKTAFMLDLAHVILTSVTRDDLPDYGSGQFVRIIELLRELYPNPTIEVLTPDFCGNSDSIDRVLDSKPDIFAHNIETVEEIFGSVRQEGNYALSIRLLERVSAAGFKAKSGLMVGLGETHAQIKKALSDLRNAGVSRVAIGQYLKPKAGCAEVARYYTPEEFEELAAFTREAGFEVVTAGPFVRSSYKTGFLDGK